MKLLLVGGPPSTGKTTTIQRIIEKRKDKHKIAYLTFDDGPSKKITPQILDVLKEYDIKKCYYGHLHGKSHQDAIEGKVNGIELKLISSDYIDFKPLKVL